MKTTHGEESCDIREGRESGEMKLLASRAHTKVNEMNALQMKGGGARLLLSLSVARRVTALLVAGNIGSREGVERAVGDEKGDVRGGCKWRQSRPSLWTQNAAGECAYLFVGTRRRRRRWRAKDEGCMAQHVRRWSRLERGDSTPLGSISAELALRSGMRDDVVVDEDVLRLLVFEVVRLRTAVTEDRTRLDGARAPSRDGSAPSAWTLAWSFVGKVSGRMLVTVSMKYCAKTGKTLPLLQHAMENPSIRKTPPRNFAAFSRKFVQNILNSLNEQIDPEYVTPQENIVNSATYEQNFFGVASRLWNCFGVFTFLRSKHREEALFIGVNYTRSSLPGPESVATDS
ncbi:hypothetical protein DFH08DRAFT_940120 [Mycena albidolilacea]|uniref:Uncharacterized protein n=1 Tax=Mycena albidolilacea TaxID=1033008 RepID=A0AAD7EJQ7_9AGAR|nr:hypothetical protein DFH08DRAFT_940120 [Mycena albidolilacea]